ncbi:MAG: aldo/keto reductase [Eubacteriales bacterium]|nr:aldo/keto reductase [Eubacteriales bacterium]
MGFENGKILGFGCMRMPLLDRKNQASFDYTQIEAMFDAFIEQGFTYFDTAYTYHAFQSECAVKKALVERYPRDTYELATKLYLSKFKTKEEMEALFNEQLEKCGVEFFDYYLLHNMGQRVYKKCVDTDAFHFIKEKKEAGKAKNVGMSFHDSPELLEEILEKYADCLDFVQLQVNYVDMDQANVQSRKCLAVAQKYNLPVVVMEPCKGGTLVNVPEEAKKLMEEFNPDTSIASWALRFAASQPGVVRVLSGMGDMNQVMDNCSTFTDFQPINEEEQKVIDQVIEIINSKTAVPCTACEYCTAGCPKNIAIPQYFAAYNSIMRTSKGFSSQLVYYNNTVLNNHGRASECIECGKCEQACPQHLPIRQYLKDVAMKFEGMKKV